MVSYVIRGKFQGIALNLNGGFGLRPSSGILKTRQQRFGNSVYFHPQVRGEAPTLLAALRRANLNHCKTHDEV
jgi:hypothetical protein